MNGAVITSNNLRQGLTAILPCSEGNKELTKNDRNIKFMGQLTAMRTEKS